MNTPKCCFAMMPRSRALLPRHPVVRHFSTSRHARQESQPRASFSSRLRSRLKSTPVKWTVLPLGMGAAVLVGLDIWKQQRRSASYTDATRVDGDGQVKVKGAWQVHVIGALPLKTLSRIYGAFNDWTLPSWFRVPGYKLYGYIFGVDFSEVPEPLENYPSLSAFFMRSMKPGCRTPEDALLISPADGRVVNFGYIENRQVEQVKGVTYSLDALLGGTGPAPTPSTIQPTSVDAPQRNHALVNEEEFANVNGIEYSLEELIGKEGATEKKNDANVVDATMDEAKGTTLHDAAVAIEVAPASMPWTVKGVPKPGNKMFFAVVYLAPGDYHRFHSPTSWVVERRRHFAGELFSVSPWMSKKLANLFVLNERVTLLGRWRYGFFSMTPVGATNVGRIVINFDKELATNAKHTDTEPGKFTEANYASASRILHGQPLAAFDEVGGFKLGSTIVMVFEAPEEAKFVIEKGSKVKVGQAMLRLPS